MLLSMFMYRNVVESLLEQKIYWGCSWTGILLSMFMTRNVVESLLEQKRYWGCSWIGMLLSLFMNRNAMHTITYDSYVTTQIVEICYNAKCKKKIIEICYNAKCRNVENSAFFCIDANAKCRNFLHFGLALTQNVENNFSTSCVDIVNIDIKSWNVEPDFRKCMWLYSVSPSVRCTMYCF